jgi:hypothetical protein
MSKVITFSRVFPGYHPRAGEQTYFVEKIWKSFYNKGTGLPLDFHSYVDAYIETGLIEHSSFESHVTLYDRINPKHHTIRAGHRFKAGDWFSPRVWSGTPYRSKQIQFAPDIQVKKTWDFYRDSYQWDAPAAIEIMAKNDGLSIVDFIDWFQLAKGNQFVGQIICWNESINY